MGLTDYRGNFGGALDIAALGQTTKNFTADINWGVASTAVDAQNHPLTPDMGQSDLGIHIFTEDGITGNGADLLIRLLADDDSGFGSATTVFEKDLGDPGAGGIAAGYDWGVFKIPSGNGEQYWRMQVENTDGVVAVGAGATISARVVKYPV